MRCEKGERVLHVYNIVRSTSLHYSGRDVLRPNIHLSFSISSICLTLFLGSPLSPFSTYSFDESQTQDANDFPAISENGDL